MAVEEGVYLSRFYDLDGNKRNFYAEDIYERTLKFTISEYIKFFSKNREILETAVESKKLFEVYPNIDTRNSESLGYVKKGDICWVEDASDDPTVKSGGAAYLSEDGITWTKISETESIDVVQDWKDIAEKPDSTVGEIDSTVSKVHTHNLQVLDDITCENNNLSFNSKILDGKKGIEITSNGTEYNRIVCEVKEIEIPENS